MPAKGLSAHQLTTLKAGPGGPKGLRRPDQIRCACFFQTPSCVSRYAHLNTAPGDGSTLYTDGTCQNSHRVSTTKWNSQSCAILLQRPVSYPYPCHSNLRFSSYSPQLKKHDVRGCCCMYKKKYHQCPFITFACSRQSVKELLYYDVDRRWVVICNNCLVHVLTAKNRTIGELTYLIEYPFWHRDWQH